MSDEIILQSWVKVSFINNLDDDDFILLLEEVSGLLPSLSSTRATDRTTEVLDELEFPIHIIKTGQNLSRISIIFGSICF